MERKVSSPRCVASLAEKGENEGEALLRSRKEAPSSPENILILLETGARAEVGDSVGEVHLHLSNTGT